MVPGAVARPFRPQPVPRVPRPPTHSPLATPAAGPLTALPARCPPCRFVESFNISVACALIMWEARRLRIERLGCHGDLAPEDRRVLQAVRAGAPEQRPACWQPASRPPACAACLAAACRPVLPACEPPLRPGDCCPLLRVFLTRCRSLHSTHRACALAPALPAWMLQVMMLRHKGQASEYVTSLLDRPPPEWQAFRGSWEGKAFADSKGRVARLPRRRRADEEGQ